MRTPIIALLTDFGTRDHYVGAMKGAVLEICPESTLVDLTHHIAAHDVSGAALHLASVYRAFPQATIFLVVVDPGVGSARRAIAVEAGGYRFVAPDNGVLSAVLDEQAEFRMVELTNARFARPTVSRTFEGRDRFAPAAAWLARGIDLGDLGPACSQPQRVDLPRPMTSGGTLEGQIVHVDRFGNLITNIDRKAFEALPPGPLAIEVNGQTISRMAATYADVDAGTLCALFGSSDHLEIAVSGGSAEHALRVGRGAGVVIRVDADQRGGHSARDTIFRS
jgi:S-adenosylmethionine hydrolase